MTVDSTAIRVLPEKTGTSVGLRSVSFSYAVAHDQSFSTAVGTAVEAPIVEIKSGLLFMELVGLKHRSDFILVDRAASNGAVTTPNLGRYAIHCSGGQQLLAAFTGTHQLLQ
jgi:hypothetical protein